MRVGARICRAGRRRTCLARGDDDGQHVGGVRLISQAVRPRLAFFSLLAMLGVAAGLVAEPALAQNVRNLPSTITPGVTPPPAPPVPQENQFDFSIQSPGRAPVPRAADELVFTLRDITISGATVYSPESLHPLYEPLIGHDVKLADIVAVADAIEAKY